MAEYSRFENGMKGSSYLQIPGPAPLLAAAGSLCCAVLTGRVWLPEAIKWFTAGIEYHHIHHLNTRVPLYRIRCSPHLPRAVRLQRHPPTLVVRCRCFARRLIRTFRWHWQEIPSIFLSFCV